MGVDHAAEAGRAERSVTELQAELAEAEQRAEQASRLATEQAKAAEAERAKAEQQGKARLAALTREAGEPLPDAGPILA